MPPKLTYLCLQVILGGRCTGVWVDKVQASPICAYLFDGGWTLDHSLNCVQLGMRVSMCASATPPGPTYAGRLRVTCVLLAAAPCGF